VKKKKSWWDWILIIAVLLGAAVYWKTGQGDAPSELASYFVEKGELRKTVEAGSSIEPKNRVEIVPPVAGRVDKILADQGQRVKKGQILAWMSSNDRAALLDAALAQGPTVHAEWEKKYRPTPILAPVEGFLIERNIVEGQTVNPGSSMFTLADRLIVRARVDESEISKIRIGLRANVVADALPDQPFKARVVLVDFQSQNIGGVKAYEVELEPANLPKGLRSGMSARVDFVIHRKKGAKLLPVGVVKGAQETKFTLKVRRADGSIEQVNVLLGISNGSKVEILNGLEVGDEVVVEKPDFAKKQSLKNPFDPFGGRKKKKGKKRRRSAH